MAEWCVQSPKRPFITLGFPDEISTFAFTGPSRLLVASSFYLQLFDTDTMELIDQASTPSVISSMSVSPKREKVACVCSNGSEIILAEQKKLSFLERINLGRWNESVSEVQFSPDGRFLAGRTKGKSRYPVIFWDIEKLKPYPMEMSKEVELYAMDYSPNGKWFAFSDGWPIDGHIWLKDLESGNMETVNVPHGSKKLKFTADSKKLLARGGNSWYSVLAYALDNLNAGPLEIIPDAQINPFAVDLAVARTGQLLILCYCRELFVCDSEGVTIETIKLDYDCGLDKVGVSPFDSMVVCSAHFHVRCYGRGHRSRDVLFIWRNLF